MTNQTKASPNCRGNHDNQDPNCKECSRTNNTHYLRCRHNTNQETPMSAIQASMQHKFGGRIQVQKRSKTK